MATSSVSSSAMSLTGIFSQLDTDAMVQVLMASDQNRYDSLEARKSDYSNQQSLFRSINTKLSALKTAAFNLTLASSFTKTAASSSDTKVLTTTSNSGAAAGTYQVEVTQLAQAHSIKGANISASGTTLKSSFATAQDITINGVTIKVSELAASAKTDKELLTSIKNAINSGDTGLTASVMQTSDDNVSLVLTTKKSGEGNAIRYDESSTATAGTFSGGFNTLQALGLFGGTNTAATIQNEVTSAQDAVLKVNGVSVTSSSNTVKDAIEGVTFTLVDDGTTTVTVNSDTKAIGDAVEAFVTAYNDIIDAVKEAKAYKDSNGRTTLQSDSTLNSLVNQISGWLTGQVGQTNGGAAGSSDFAYKYLFEVGLEVDKGVTTASEMTGKITFDREKFEEALSDNPEGVIQLFRYNGKDEGKASGIAQVFNTNLTTWTSFSSGILKNKIDGYDSEISFITDQMDQMKNRLEVKEASLKAKFSNMEVSLSNLQGTQSYLTGIVSSFYN
ncbi:flagellar filament capping protein FliD [Cohnella algarum]|uniref:flagellar filament capping protein FliD n=1 Tax=Cohnella algarum TaxID=2044859 RepID=UPI001967658B|nr:flagellar filament capping protein FliD [Cohnella algarum]MBN2980629.1 flagellar filament capping protein FliD [Cohnella algarum]